MRHITPSIFLFGIPLGILGAAFNAQHLQVLFSMQHDLAAGLRWYGLLSLILVAVIYLLGWLQQQEQQKFEWQDPAKRAFISAIMLSLFLAWNNLVAGGVLSGSSSMMIAALLMLGLLQIGLNIYLISGWLFNYELKIHHLQPTWFILLSGNFMASIIFSSQFTYNSLWQTELAFLFFAIGCFWWLVMVTLLLYRLWFYPAIELNSRPSLFIFLAPISLSAIAALELSGSQTSGSELNVISWIGLSFATLFFVLWIVNLRKFIECGLGLSSWAYIYPLAAYGLLLQYVAQWLDSRWLLWSSVAIFIATLAMIALLTVWSIKQLWQSKRTENHRC